MATVEAMMVEEAVQLEQIPELCSGDCVALRRIERKMRGVLEGSVKGHKLSGHFQASPFSPIDYRGKILYLSCL